MNVRQKLAATAELTRSRTPASSGKRCFFTYLTALLSDYPTNIKSTCHFTQELDLRGCSNRLSAINTGRGPLHLLPTSNPTATSPPCQLPYTQCSLAQNDSPHNTMQMPMSSRGSRATTRQCSRTVSNTELKATPSPVHASLSSRVNVHSCRSSAPL